jgi:protein-S-isoprenylcysteine O-methyltransferase Ste14
MSTKKHTEHPHLTGEHRLGDMGQLILFYLGASLITLSLASFLFWLVIITFYILIARYEERILTKEFGEDYLNYKKKTGMLFPKLFR